MGDLDGDGDNDFADFRLFQADYVAANGAAAFEALLNVPEPTAALSLLLMACGASSCGLRSATSVSTATLPSGCDGSLRRAGLLRGRDVQSPAVCIASSASAALRHRYSFNEGADRQCQWPRRSSTRWVAANGTVIGPATGARIPRQRPSQLILPGGAKCRRQPYVDLPNGIISSLTDVTFEAWYTIDTTWARLGPAFSTSDPPTGGELTGPGGGGEGLDYIFYAPMRGNHYRSAARGASQQRSALRARRQRRVPSAALRHRSIPNSIIRSTCSITSHWCSTPTAATIPAKQL